MNCDPRWLKERILGPYEQAKGWRVIEVDANRTRTSRMFATEAKARRYIELLRAALCVEHIRPGAAFDLAALEASGHEPGEQHTYIIEAIGQDIVKIGKTNDIWKRFAALQTSCPHSLGLVAWLVGERMESTLHNQLAAHRLRGEWFRYVPEVDRLVGLLDKVPLKAGA